MTTEPNLTPYQAYLLKPFLKEMKHFAMGDNKPFVYNGWEYIVDSNESAVLNDDWNFVCCWRTGTDDVFFPEGDEGSLITPETKWCTPQEL